MPKNAPISIIPSSAMFTTPLCSENIPPSAPKVSGVAKTSIEAMIEALKTSFRLPVPDWRARAPSPAPRTPAATAVQPSLRTPRERAATPPRAARRPSRTGQMTVRTVNGGSATKQASTPSAIP